jgi:hypothetical protein
MKITAKDVALALAKANPLAGQAYDAIGVDYIQSVEARANNLLVVGQYGAYVVDGDPNGWSDCGAIATIYMESKGGEGDCVVPLDYYEDGHDYALSASDLLPENCYIEFINAAVAAVYEF